MDWFRIAYHAAVSLRDPRCAKPFSDASGQLLSRPQPQRLFLCGFDVATELPPTFHLQPD
jgi:hypothetical protein